METNVKKLEQFIIEKCGDCYCEYVEENGWYFIIPSTNHENETKIHEYALTLGIDGTQYDEIDDEMRMEIYVSDPKFHDLVECENTLEINYD